MLLRDMVDSQEKPCGRETAESPPAPSIPENVMWYVIESRLLEGEKILLVTKKKYLKQARKEHPDKVIYFTPEIEELCRLKNDMENESHFRDGLKKIHTAKKELKGWIVPTQK